MWKRSSINYTVFAAMLEQRQYIYGPLDVHLRLPHAIDVSKLAVQPLISLEYSLLANVESYVVIPGGGTSSEETLLIRSGISPQLHRFGSINSQLGS